MFYNITIGAVMRTLLIIICVAFFASLTSCGSVQSHINTNKEVAGYTLKSKKELLQQKVLNTSIKTVIVEP
ncbi:MAG: hypothetical protein CMC14_04875 [Flavobacteriaceae bacterium]|nr:hypothetical protein [Flavobacteriaceae bacterium]